MLICSAGEQKVKQTEGTIEFVEPAVARRVNGAWAVGTCRVTSQHGNYCSLKYYMKSRYKCSLWPYRIFVYIRFSGSVSNTHTHRTPSFAICGLIFLYTHHKMYLLVIFLISFQSFACYPTIQHLLRKRLAPGLWLCTHKKCFEAVDRYETGRLRFQCIRFQNSC